MSSFTRTIQRTLKRKDDPVCRHPFYMGRGMYLGVSNPKDPCRTHIEKARKPWRSKINAPPAKPASALKPSPRRTKEELREDHRAKMLKKHWRKRQRAAKKRDLAREG